MQFDGRLAKVALYGLISLVTVLAFYLLNLLILQSSSFISPTEGLFIEGVVLLNLGVGLLLGRGGMSLASLRAALLSAEAEAVCGTDAVGPAELMRRDKWKPKGFHRASRFLLLTGSLLIIAYLSAIQ
ncbi:MAG: hypothetical protein JSV35_06640 [Candidatus Bathyarchaeota archaeon]|nr:MAG: hypothetical protein JSV35_06640 [Candidatus Bathyarchaeota archaeon]